MTTDRKNIVLVTGFLGFRKVLCYQMFRGVKEALEKDGHRVIQPITPPTGSIVERAEAIFNEVKNWLPEGEKAIIIAHSMGGLDARYLVSPNGLNTGNSFNKIFTICTPHYGTMIAKKTPKFFIGLCRAIFFLLSILTSGESKDFFSSASKNPCKALQDLTPESLINFNEKIINSESVDYYSVGADMTKKEKKNFLFHIRKLVSILAGISNSGNDGIVPTDSMKWGKYLETFNVDHGEIIGLSLVPWVKPNIDYIDLYKKLARNELTK